MVISLRYQLARLAIVECCLGDIALRVGVGGLGPGVVNREEACFGVKAGGKHPVASFVNVENGVLVGVLCGGDDLAHHCELISVLAGRQGVGGPPVEQLVTRVTTVIGQPGVQGARVGQGLVQLHALIGHYHRQGGHCAADLADCLRAVPQGI